MDTALLAHHPPPLPSRRPAAGDLLDAANSLTQYEQFMEGVGEELVSQWQQRLDQGGISGALLGVTPALGMATLLLGCACWVLRNVLSRQVHVAPYARASTLEATAHPEDSDDDDEEQYRRPVRSETGSPAHAARAAAGMEVLDADDDIDDRLVGRAATVRANQCSGRATGVRRESESIVSC